MEGPDGGGRATRASRRSGRQKGKAPTLEEVDFIDEQQQDQEGEPIDILAAAATDRRLRAGGPPKKFGRRLPTRSSLRERSTGVEKGGSLQSPFWTSGLPVPSRPGPGQLKGTEYHDEDEVEEEDEGVEEEEEEGSEMDEDVEADEHEHEHEQYDDDNESIEAEVVHHDEGQAYDFQQARAEVHVHEGGRHEGDVFGDAEEDEEVGVEGSASAWARKVVDYEQEVAAAQQAQLPPDAAVGHVGHPGMGVALPDVDALPEPLPEEQHPQDEHFAPGVVAAGVPPEGPHEDLIDQDQDHHQQEGSEGPHEDDDRELQGTPGSSHLDRRKYPVNFSPRYSRLIHPSQRNLYTPTGGCRRCELGQKFKKGHAQTCPKSRYFHDSKHLEMRSAQDMDSADDEFDDEDSYFSDDDDDRTGRRRMPGTRTVYVYRLPESGNFGLNLTERSSGGRKWVSIRKLLLPPNNPLHKLAPAGSAILTVNGLDVVGWDLERVVRRIAETEDEVLILDVRVSMTEEEARAGVAGMGGFVPSRESSKRIAIEGRGRGGGGRTRAIIDIDPIDAPAEKYVIKDAEGTILLDQFDNTAVDLSDFDLEKSDPVWYKNFRKLLALRNRQLIDPRSTGVPGWIDPPLTSIDGHDRHRSRHPELRTWVDEQRTMYSERRAHLAGKDANSDEVKSTLAKMAVLNDEHFVWISSSESELRRSIECLRGGVDEEWRQYYLLYAGHVFDRGHGYVPGYTELGMWCGIQRAKRREGTLRWDKVLRLSSLGFDWTEEGDELADWSEMRSRYEAHRKKNGDGLIMPPPDVDDPSGEKDWRELLRGPYVKRKYKKRVKPGAEQTNTEEKKDDARTDGEEEGETTRVYAKDDEEDVENKKDDAMDIEEETEAKKDDAKDSEGGEGEAKEDAKDDEEEAKDDVKDDDDDEEEAESKKVTKGDDDNEEEEANKPSSTAEDEEMAEDGDAEKTAEDEEDKTEEDAEKEDSATDAAEGTAEGKDDTAAKDDGKPEGEPKTPAESTTQEGDATTKDPAASTPPTTEEEPTEEEDDEDYLLWWWAQYQRIEHTRQLQGMDSDLTPRHVSRLDDLDFIWNSAQNARWIRNYRDLKAYYAAKKKTAATIGGLAAGTKVAQALGNDVMNRLKDFRKKVRSQCKSMKRREKKDRFKIEREAAKEAADLARKTKVEEEQKKAGEVDEDDEEKAKEEEPSGSGKEEGKEDEAAGGGTEESAEGKEDAGKDDKEGEDKDKPPVKRKRGRPKGSGAASSGKAILPSLPVRDWRAFGHKGSTLTSEAIGLLDAIGFIWEENDDPEDNKGGKGFKDLEPATPQAQPVAPAAWPMNPYMMSPWMRAPGMVPVYPMNAQYQAMTPASGPKPPQPICCKAFEEYVCKSLVKPIKGKPPHDKHCRRRAEIKAKRKKRKRPAEEVEEEEKEKEKVKEEGGGDEKTEEEGKEGAPPEEGTDDKPKEGVDESTLDKLKKAYNKDETDETSSPKKKRKKRRKKRKKSEVDALQAVAGNVSVPYHWPTNATGTPVYPGMYQPYAPWAAYNPAAAAAAAAAAASTTPVKLQRQKGVFCCGAYGEYLTKQMGEGRRKGRPSHDSTCPNRVKNKRKLSREAAAAAKDGGASSSSKKAKEESSPSKDDDDKEGEEDRKEEAEGSDAPKDEAAEGSDAPKDEEDGDDKPEAADEGELAEASGAASTKEEPEDNEQGDEDEVAEESPDDDKGQDKETEDESAPKGDDKKVEASGTASTEEEPEDKGQGDEDDEVQEAKEEKEEDAEETAERRDSL